jgi:rhodanese-related sulfurtransferase
MNQSISELNNSNAVFTPAQLDDFLKNKSANVVLFDIRDNFVFGQGHIPGAENMSANDLSKKENIERLNELNKKGITVVLYGEDQLQVNGPWMLFRQAGFENVKILLGGFSYYMQNKDSLNTAAGTNKFQKEIERYDFASMAAPKDGTESAASAEKKQVNVTKRGKSAAAKGGC